MKTRSIASTIPKNTFLISFLLLLVFVMIGLYMYLLTMSVVHVVLHKELVQQIRVTETEIATLESDYIVAKHQVSDRIAAAENFTETSDKLFVQRSTDSTLVLSSITP